MSFTVPRTRAEASRLIDELRRRPPDGVAATGRASDRAGTGPRARARYATWQVAHELARAGARGRATQATQKHARSLVNEAIKLVLWLHEQQLDYVTCATADSSSLLLAEISPQAVDLRLGAPFGSSFPSRSACHAGEQGQIDAAKGSAAVLRPVRAFGGSLGP